MMRYGQFVGLQRPCGIVAMVWVFVGQRRGLVLLWRVAREVIVVVDL